LNGLSQIFQDGIDDHSVNSIWAVNRNYLVSPINGTLKYKRLGKNERGDPDTPVEKASLALSDVSLTVTEVPHYSTSLVLSVIVFTIYLLLSAILYQAQYYDGIKLLETFSRFRTRVDVSHLRPIVPVKEDRRAWWRYAMLAGLRQKKLW
jgi:vacuolar protein sorting-associated protein 13A/C